MQSEPTALDARLISPCLGYVASYLEALREGHSDTTDPHLQLPLAVIEADPSAHIAALSQRATIIRLPDGTEMGSVPYAHLWLVAGDELIGRVSIRYALNQRLIRFGGHIGYGIRPSRRQQGFGRQALVLAKANVRAHGLSRVLLTCADSNVASARIIERCGGELENIEPHSDPPHVMTRRYWIALKEAPGMDNTALPGRRTLATAPPRHRNPRQSHPEHDE
jgi:predicted acetyltransferase